MVKTISIADDLVKFAQDVTGETDERAAVEGVLRRLLPQHLQSSPNQKNQDLFDLVGKVEFFEGYDPEAEFCGARPPLTEEEKKKW